MVTTPSQWIHAALCGALCAACSTSEVIDMDPDVGTEPGIAVVGGCIATITYAGGGDSVELDRLVYDAKLHLLEQKRRYADGIETTRSWQWSDTGLTAERPYFDGTREAAFDDFGRITAITTYGEDGRPLWSDSVRYGELGLLAARQANEFEGGVQISSRATVYEYENGVPAVAMTTSSTDPDDVSIVAYAYAVRGEDILLTAHHDSDADGLIDFETSVLIAPDGLVKEGVDKDGNAVSYDYEGPRCAEVAASWQFGDPFYFDL